MARPEPGCQVSFRNGDATRLLESYPDIQAKRDDAKPGEMYEVQTFTDSLDGKERVVHRASIELAEVYRIDELTDEFLTQERIAQAQVGAAQPGGLA